MRERAKLIFPYAIAAIVPLAGLVLAVGALIEKRQSEAAVLLAASVLGALIWTLALGA